MFKKLLSSVPYPVLVISLFLCIFTFLIPPFQKPDEPLHFERAFALAQGQFVCRHDSKHERGYFNFPQSIQIFPDQMMSQSIIMKTEGKFPIALMKTSYPIDSKYTVDLLYNCTLPFIGYIPQSVGILLSLPFNNVLISFYAARLFGALFFIMTLSICLRLIPKQYRLILLFCSFLPMVLQQVTAISYDCVSISLGFALFTLFVRFLNQKTIPIRAVLAFYGVLLLFLFSKPGFYLYALLLAYPIQRTSLPIIKKIAVGAVLFLGVACMAFYSLTVPI